LLRFGGDRRLAPEWLIFGSPWALNGDEKGAAVAGDPHSHAAIARRAPVKRDY
jgi:hypothetical protein